MFPIDLKSLNEQQRHDYILKNYVLNKEENSRKQKRDIDVIKENHRFLWDVTETPDTWEKQLARRYYDKLFKEYCISDLSYYKDNKVALRWRVEAEVISGKGQFQCGNRKCDEREDLKSWEVNFAYLEEASRKNALVKLRLCPKHSTQLNYSTRKREVKRLKQTAKLQKKEAKREKNKRKRKKDKNETATGSEEEQYTDETEKLDNSAVEASTSKDTNTRTNNKKLDVDIRKKREKEFELFVEDLLL